MAAGWSAATAVTGSAPAGRWYRRSAGTTAYSAKEPCRPPWPRLLHHTRSRGANPAAPGPAAATVPTRSRPTTNGNGVGVAYAPDRTRVSTGSTATTSTWTSTSVGPGSGTGSAPTLMASAGPSSVT